MGKPKTTFEIESYGLYSTWDRNSKELPKIIQFTTKIPALVDNEFGYILRIKKAKGQKIDFSINHPNIPDDNSNKPMPPFTGEVYISTNDFRFYIGDCIWEPVENKTGLWEIITYMNNKELFRKTFEVI